MLDEAWHLRDLLNVEELIQVDRAAAVAVEGVEEHLCVLCLLLLLLGDARELGLVLDDQLPVWGGEMRRRGREEEGEAAEERQEESRRGKPEAEEEELACIICATCSLLSVGYLRRISLSKRPTLHTPSLCCCLKSEKRRSTSRCRSGCRNGGGDGPPALLAPSSSAPPAAAAPAARAAPARIAAEADAARVMMRPPLACGCSTGGESAWMGWVDGGGRSVRASSLRDTREERRRAGEVRGER